MHRLKDEHKGKSAIIIFGGPSIFENDYNLSLLNKTNHVVFLESKALTKEFLKFNISPDYYFMPYPEKTRTNTLQHQFIQSVSCNFNLGPLLKRKHADEWYEFKDNFKKKLDVNRVDYPHKKYRVKKDVILENSPLSILRAMPDIPLITYDKAYNADLFSTLELDNCVYKYTVDEGVSNNIKDYLNPKVLNSKLTIKNMGYANSAAISLYPLLTHMGFEKVFFIGMDMSVLGAFEYSSVNTFKSMRKYKLFFNAARSTFSYDFPRGLGKGLLSLGRSIYNDLYGLNLYRLFSSDKFKKLYHDSYGLAGEFMREKSQLEDCGVIFNLSNIEYVNIYEEYKYALPIPGIKNISYQEFLHRSIK